MNMMTGYIASTSGQILINGHDILTETEEAKKCIGYLPEIPPLYEDMTVWEYLITVADLKRVPKKERGEMLAQIMETVKITDMKKRLIKNLSKGYRQRVGIAQALIGYPEIIILDEPTVGLDPQQIIEIRNLVKSLGEKHTVILSSHILTEISAVCDYVLIINKGRLVASDETANLSKMFAGQNSLELVVETTREVAEDVLLGVEGINSVQYTPGEAGTLQIEVQAALDQDIRRDIFFAFAEAHVAILEMKNASATLEDIFLEVTKNAQEEITAADSEEEA
jgi:ABC-2 type transport system ATP-binding protein